MSAQQAERLKGCSAGAERNKLKKNRNYNTFGGILSAFSQERAKWKERDKDKHRLYMSSTAAI